MKVLKLVFCSLMLAPACAGRSPAAEAAAGAAAPPALRGAAGGSGGESKSLRFLMSADRRAFSDRSGGGGPGGGGGGGANGGNSGGGRGPGGGDKPGPRGPQDARPRLDRKFKPGDVDEFMQAHSRCRYEEWKRNHPNAAPDARMMDKHFELMQLQKRDPDLFKLKVQQIESDDAIFRLVKDHKKAAAGQDETFKQQLHEAIAGDVETRHAERRRRIEKARDALKAARQQVPNPSPERRQKLDAAAGDIDREEEKLKLAEAGKEKIIDRRVHRALQGNLAPDGDAQEPWNPPATQSGPRKGESQ